MVFTRLYNWRCPGPRLWPFHRPVTAHCIQKALTPQSRRSLSFLAANRTEITDALIPYELFSASGAYNVYAVAPERTTTSLSSGLEVMPDYSYAELDKLL